MENDSIEKFIKNNKIFHCLLTPVNVEIKTNFGCFNEFPNDKINNSEENIFRIKKYKNESNFQIVEESSLSKTLKYIKEKLNINAFSSSKEEKKNTSNIIIGKYKTYSLRINEKDISFNDDYYKKFEKIAQDIPPTNKKFNI